MAEGKNTIVVYLDWRAIFEKLEDGEAGRLIKHFFRYVDDENPEPPDRVTELTFEPIKQTLKRDLKKWESVVAKRREAGAKGGKQKVANAKKNVANQAVSDNVSDNVSDSVSEPYTFRIRERIFKEPLSEFFSINYASYLEQWAMSHPAEKKEIPLALKKMDTEYFQYQFNNENHLRNAFKVCWNKRHKEPSENTKTKIAW